MTVYPTLVIHSVFSNLLSRRKLPRVLRQFRIDVHEIKPQQLRPLPPNESLELIDKTVIDILESSGAPKLNLICMDSSGLLGLNLLRHRQGHRKIHTLITLGTPFRGSEKFQRFSNTANLTTWAKHLCHESDFIKSLHKPYLFPKKPARIISIYGNNDPLADRERASIPEAEILQAPVNQWPFGHFQLTTSDANIKLIVSQLTDNIATLNTDSNDIITHKISAQ